MSLYTIPPSRIANPARIQLGGAPLAALVAVGVTGLGLGPISAKIIAHETG